MNSLEAELTDTLLSMAQREERPSAMLYAILSRLSPTPVDRLLLVHYFSRSFCFTEGQGHPIFGWFPDGHGELTDADIDRIMSKRMQQTRVEWDRPSTPKLVH